MIIKKTVLKNEKTNKYIRFSIGKFGNYDEFCIDEVLEASHIDWFGTYILDNLKEYKKNGYELFHLTIHVSEEKYS